MGFLTILVFTIILLILVLCFVIAAFALGTIAVDVANATHKIWKDYGER